MNDKIEIKPQVISPLKKICMTIGELPTSYLETMTYYEMLVWFTNYLRDTVIPVVNNNGEAVTELQNLFVELQTYVNDYFDNLDVQDEINNKIDQMLEDGSLQEILINYFNTKYAKDGMINILDYGAKCDGETDDTDAVKDAIADLGTEINGVMCKTLVIPGKTVITDKLTIDIDGVTIKGYNINSCQLLFQGESAYLEFKKSDGARIYESQIRDLYVRGNFTQDQLILFYNCVNIYLNRVYVNECEASQYLIKFTNDSNIIFINECILDSSEDVQTYPAISNGIFLSSQPAIFTFTKNNCWNLNHVIDCEGICLNTNIQDNWIENCNVFFKHSNTNDLRYVNFNFENNTFSVHSYLGYTPNNVQLLTFDETSGTNMWNSFIKIRNNNFYLYNIDNLYNNTLIGFNNIDPSGTVYVSYANNVYSGKTLATLNSYVVNLNSTIQNTIRFTEVIAQAPNDGNYICNYPQAICCIILSTTSDRIPSAPRGLYLCKSSTNNKGLLYYDSDTDKLVCGYNGTLQTLPKKWTGETIPYPITSENYIEALNVMARVINNSGIGVIQQ